MIVQKRGQEESVRMTKDRDKCRKYVRGVADPRMKDGAKEQNRTEQRLLKQWIVDISPVNLSVKDAPQSRPMSKRDEIWNEHTSMSFSMYRFARYSDCHDSTYTPV